MTSGTEMAIDWQSLPPAEQKRQLFQKQKELLDTFRSRNAITQEQYDKSLGDLKIKMGISPEGIY